MDIKYKGKLAVCTSSALLTVAPAIAFKKAYNVYPRTK